MTKKKSSLPKGKETILLVEDEKDVRTLTARVLKRQGYHVIEAEEGRQAIELSDKYKGHIDLLLTDVVMPYMNGKMLAEQLIARRKNIKVLYISGHIDSMITQYGIAGTEESFLQKPYTIDALNTKIRNLFDN